MTFEEYLTKKKIDPEAFKAWDKGMFATWKSDFAAYHPDSFTMQYKFLLNNTRRTIQAFQINQK